MRILDRTNMARKYRGKWLALKADRKTVVAVAGTVREAQAKAMEKGCRTPIITRMPRAVRSFVGLQRAV
jgi:hypothetical protein